LQGYFNSPDIVLFLNHDEIGNEILATIQKHPEQKTWFHAGEFSDSLALSHLTGEVDFYWSLLADHPKAYLELRTKSVNIKPVLKQKPAANIFVTFSLSPARRALQSDLKTPTTAARLQAMKALVDAGFCVGVHLDPMIYDVDFVQNYQRLIEEWVRLIPPEKISYISVGVVRFSKDVYRQVKTNYPDSDLLQQEFTSGFDKKIRYSYPIRSVMMNTVKKQLLQSGFQDSQIYFCMENDDSF
jgi:spore photoproduct lyase